MGTRRTRPGTVKEQPKPKRKYDTSKHRELCLLAAKWLNRSGKIHSRVYVAIELCSQTWENPDVIGWGSGVSTLVEVKTSRADFLKDAKKEFRINQNQGMGNYRYYCCPKGLIKESELPTDWGLLYEDNGKIELIKMAETQAFKDGGSEICLLLSIMRREGIKRGIFDYRLTKTK